MSVIDEETIADDEVESAAAKPSSRSSRFKADVVSDEVEVPDFTIEDVAKFLVLRQEVWYKKEVLKEEWPLTEDPVLKSFRICNIFREQDAGTRRLLEMLAEHGGDPKTVKALNVAVYRLLNRADTWTKYIGWIPEHAMGETLANAFVDMGVAQELGEKILTRAWRATSLETLEQQASAIYEGLDEITAIAQTARSLRTLHAVLANGYGIGDFVAYQIAVDLKLVYPNLSNEDWIHVGGKGARGRQGHGGSMWMLRRLGLPGEDALETAIRLRDTQESWVPAELWDYSPPRERFGLTLEDVDNLACEFRKYWFRLHGLGNLQRFGPEPVHSHTRTGSRRNGGGRGTRQSEATNWETPRELFKQLDEEFNFTVDAAATAENAKCEMFWTQDDDALSQAWTGHTVYVFPPFHELGLWTYKAKEEARSGVTSVILSPAFTETRWWFENVVEDAAEIRFVRGMVQFEENGEPRDTVYQNAVAVLVYRPKPSVLIDPWPRIDLAYTYPGRKPVAKSGWTGWIDGER